MSETRISLQEIKSIAKQRECGGCDCGGADGHCCHINEDADIESPCIECDDACGFDDDEP